MATEISQSPGVHVRNNNRTNAGGGPFGAIRPPEELLSQQCESIIFFIFLFTLVFPRQGARPSSASRSAVTQMSRPSQSKVSSSEHNGVSVIQSQSHAAAAAAALLQQVPQLVPAHPSSPGGKAAAPGKMKKVQADKDSDEYRQRRERNNLAVKKSRQRSKQKAMDTQQRVNQLKEENERLEAKIKLLSKELSVLKDLFLEHAHNLADNVQPPSGNPDASPAPDNQ
ncbi:CCAAT/enhancer-binding protein gamma isoform X2 [Syngnathoides biaculeatus]|uniref:CCAAT/enhancer-binding protein gamma isoform X2 n=1 Tax=Syngnathoides biaculeatus TaxID=300417 RepID=UPI002ADE58E2|nr:CCAAT/enhancer-binding protein gamma isoform X2 [Syngnathoides biaculeatus]